MAVTNICVVKWCYSFYLMYLLNIHLRFHWREWIEQFGAPCYYSTMHWESKHKQLKLIKENKTNNSNHYKDIFLILNVVNVDFFIINFAFL